MLIDVFRRSFESTEIKAKLGGSSIIYGPGFLVLSFFENSFVEVDATYCFLAYPLVLIPLIFF